MHILWCDWVIKRALLKTHFQYLQCLYFFLDYGLKTTSCLATVLFETYVRSSGYSAATTLTASWDTQAWLLHFHHVLDADEYWATEWIARGYPTTHYMWQQRQSKQNNNNNNGKRVFLSQFPLHVGIAKISFGHFVIQPKIFTFPGFVDGLICSHKTGKFQSQGFTSSSLPSGLLYFGGFYGVTTQ